MLFASCRTLPDRIEGRVTEMQISLSTDSKNHLEMKKCTARITTETKETYDVNLTYGLGFECGDYVRLDKNNDGTFSTREIAMLDYDHGTPPRYVFTSDSTVAGFMKK